MRVITPIEIGDSELISSTIAEPTVGIDPDVWVSGRGYAIGDSVYHDTTHKVYTTVATITAGSAASLVSPPTDIQLAIPKWTEVGSTNRWNMFDVYRNTATEVTSTTATIVLGTPLEEETTDFDPYFDNVKLLLQVYPPNVTWYAIKDQSKYNRTPQTLNLGTLTADDTTMGSPSINYAGGFIQYADSDDWHFTGDFTIDVEVMFSTYARNGSNRISIMGQADGSGYGSWSLDCTMAGNLVISWRLADTTNYVLVGSTTMLANVKYHLALVRYGDVITLYVDGVPEIVSVLPVSQAFLNISNKLGIGILGEYDYSWGGEYGTKMIGWIRAVRITKGVARYTAPFTVPTIPFATSGIKYVPASIDIGSLFTSDIYSNNVVLKLNNISVIPPIDSSTNALVPSYVHSTGLAVDSSTMTIPSLNFTGGYVQYDPAPIYPGSSNFTWEFYLRFNTDSVGDRVIIAGQAGSSGSDNIWFIGKHTNETVYAIFKCTDGITYYNNSILKVIPDVDYHVVLERYGDLITLYFNNIVYLRFSVVGAMAVSSTKVAIGKNGEDAIGGYGGIAGTQMMGNIGYARFTNGIARYTRVLGGFLDSSKSLALLDLNNVGSVRVVCDYPSGTGYTTISDNLYYMNVRNVYDWWTYFTTQFIPKKSLVLEELPTGYANMRVSITFTGSNPMSIGSCILGDSTFIGRLGQGAELDILNFSTMERDMFGNAILVPRKEISTLSAKLYVDKRIFENVQLIKNDLDAKPAVWVGIDDPEDPYYHSLIFLGVYRDFNFQLDNPIGPTASLEVEEL